MTPDRVEIRSDHGYIGHPLAFYWQGKRLEVAEILLQNRTPSGYTFRVHCVNVGIFELEYEINTGEWSVYHL